MNKPTVQKDALEPEAQEPRKLNMEEKRKLEKLLIADIDSATSRYDAVTREERRALTARLQRTPSVEAKTLYERHQLARKQQEELKKKLKALGYDIDYYGALEVNVSGTLAKQLADSGALKVEETGGERADDELMSKALDDDALVATVDEALIEQLRAARIGVLRLRGGRVELDGTI